MKTCQKCGYQNSDSMRFCIECGSELGGAPIIVNLQGDAASPQPQANTPVFDKSMETRVGVGRDFAGNFPTVPQARRTGGGNKIFLILGGIFLLFLLLLTAGAAVFIYNWKIKGDVVAHTSPTPTRTVEEAKTPTPKSSVTPGTSPSLTSITTPDDEPTLESDSTSTAAKGKFDDMRVDFNVSEGGRYGMRIHVTFTAYNMKGVNSQLAVYFQKPDGTALLSNSPDYRSKNGSLAVFKPLRPAYDNTEYKDLQVFMPYEELNLGRGKHDLKMDVDLILDNGDLVEHLSFYEFQYKEN